MQNARTGHVVCFGPFRLDLRAGELHEHERKILLQEQPFRILGMVVDHSGEVVTREEIRRKLRPNGTIVEFDHAINAAIKKLRKALSDSADAGLCQSRSEVLPRQRLARPQQLARCPLKHNLAPFGTCARPHVDDPIGARDYIEVVLNHDQSGSIVDHRVE
jgi:DNA-binding winged helix-turn-helix (wHTH) protein